MKNLTYTFLKILLALVSCKKIENKKIISKSEEEQIVFKNVTIFNGKDSILLKNKNVLVKNGIIKLISTTSIDTSNCLVFEAKGKTLIPGLIDAHVHLSGSGSVPWNNFKADEKYNLSAYLYAGITSIYDLGGIAKSINKISVKVNNAELIGPTIYNTHIPITVKNSHPIPLTKEVLNWPLKGLVNTISPTIDKVNEAEKIMEKYVSKPIDYVKISCDQIPPGSPEMSFEQLEALITEAHKHNKKVFVHIGSPENAVNAIKAGADVLAHGVWRGKLTPKQANIIAASKIPIIYTIAGFYNISQVYQGKFKPTKLDKLLVSDDILHPITGTNGNDVHSQKVMDAFFEDAYKKQQFWKDNFKLLHNNGAIIVVGTDSNLPGTYAGSTYFQEIELLKKYGLSNFEILKGATYLNSRLFLENPNFGSIEIGKKADLLLINGNPLKDLELLKKPTLIIKDGNIINKLIE